MGSSLRVERACIWQKPAKQIGWMAASVPPRSRCRRARADHLVGRAHRLRTRGAGGNGRVGPGACAEVERHGARGELGMSMGTASGKTRRTPFTQDVPLPEQRVQTAHAGADRDPEADRIDIGAPASAQASLAATIAYCVDGSIRRHSTLERTSSGRCAGGRRTSPASRTFDPRKSIVRIPDRPANKPSQVSAKEPPKGSWLRAGDDDATCAAHGFSFRLPWGAAWSVVCRGAGPGVQRAVRGARYGAVSAAIATLTAP